MKARSLMSLALATTVAALAAAAVLAPALAEPVQWSETGKVDGSKVLRFEVTSLTVGTKSWSAHISFRNLSSKTLRVGNVFSLTFFRTSTLTPTTRADALGRATTITPAIPTKLGPGKSWTGLIRGNARPVPALHGKVFARVVFGPFYGVPGYPNPYIWITDHSRTVNLDKKASGGLVI